MLEFTKVSEQLSEQTIKKCGECLMKLRENFSSQFSDLFSFEVQPWMMDPFGCDIERVNENMQEELIELKCNDKCKHKFERCEISELYGYQIQQNSYIQKCGLKWLKYCYTFQPLIRLNVASVQAIKF